MIVRLGSRGSQLALAQTTWVAAAIRAHHPGVRTEITIIQTQGDRAMDASLSRIGGKGVFTKEIERALLAGRIDVAVHSLKDLPTQQAPGLALGAVPERESARDVLAAGAPVELSDMGPADVVGASSLRRASQLRARFPGIVVRDIRGNVPTRLRKLAEGDFAALVLAEAGLNRLGLRPPFLRRFDDEEMIPAPGQGALGIQVRAADARVAELVGVLAHARTTACVDAERALLDALGGGCQLPLGAIAEIDGHGRLTLRARVLSPDGGTVLDGEDSGPADDGAGVGRRLAARLRGRGAAVLVEALPPVHAGAGDDATPVTADEVRVVVTRDEDADGPLSRCLRHHGVVPACLPLVRTEPAPDLEPLRAALDGRVAYAAVAVASASALDGLLATVPGAAARLAGAVAYTTGPSTAGKLRGAGFARVVEPGSGRDAMAAALVRDLGGTGGRVLYLRGDMAPPAVEQALDAAGIPHDTVTVYRTVRVDASREVLAGLLRSAAVSGVVFCSPSAVRAFADAMAATDQGLPAPPVALYSIGPSTSEAVRHHLGREPAESPGATFETLAGFIAAHSGGETPPNAPEGDRHGIDENNEE